MTKGGNMRIIQVGNNQRKEPSNTPKHVFTFEHERNPKEGIVYAKLKRKLKNSIFLIHSPA